MGVAYVTRVKGGVRHLGGYGVELCEESEVDAAVGAFFYEMRVTGKGVLVSVLKDEIALRMKQIQ